MKKKRLILLAVVCIAACVALSFTMQRVLGDQDTDGDDLPDIEEMEEYETDPEEKDTDSDGLEDGEEVNEYDTDPNEEDTDGDDFDDGEEIDEGTDPLNPDSYPAD